MKATNSRTALSNVRRAPPTARECAVVEPGLATPNTTVAKQRGNKYKNAVVIADGKKRLADKNKEARAARVRIARKRPIAEREKRLVVVPRLCPTCFLISLSLSPSPSLSPSLLASSIPPSLSFIPLARSQTLQDQDKNPVLSTAQAAQRGAAAAAVSVDAQEQRLRGRVQERVSCELAAQEERLCQLEEDLVIAEREKQEAEFAAQEYEMLRKMMKARAAAVYAVRFCEQKGSESCAKYRYANERRLLLADRYPSLPQAGKKSAK
eukprot:3542787-Pleurochrysis_carterae.AAC.5